MLEMKNMSLALPARLAEKAAGLAESSPGANRVTLVLKDGRKIFDVTLAWGREIVEIDGAPVEKKELGFGMSDIVDVLP
jgi:hypothetical protein